MALFVLPFGHAEWPCDGAPGTRAAPATDGDPSLDRVTLNLPSALTNRIEASAALEGISLDAWISRSLSRSIDPRLGAH